MATAPAPTWADRLLGGRLWRHRDFVKLWIGQGISEAGSQVTFLALPTAAILLLHAGPFEVGLLGALEFLPFPTLGLIAGVYADRIRRRPIMIVCDAGRAVLLASIPIAWLLGSLTMPQLYVVSLLMGIGTVFFDVSYQSYLPALIERRDLVEGNSKLEVSRSVAALAGPAIAGFLIQLAGAAQAMWADAASFAVSVATLLGIRKPEPPPAPGTETGRTGFFHEMWEGIGVVFGNPTLWKIAGCTATSNLGSNMIFAVFLIFVYRQLHLSPGVVGVVFAIAAVGGLTGAVMAGTIARRVGLGLTLLLAVAVGGGVWGLVPLTRYGAAVPLLLIAGFVAFFTEPLYNINQVSLRQAITPDRVQGRMNATMRTIVWGTNPIGSFLGGVLGSFLGVVPTLWIGIVIATLAAGWILAGPVRLREQPAAVS